MSIYTQHTKHIYRLPIASKWSLFAIYISMVILFFVVAFLFQPPMLLLIVLGFCFCFLFCVNAIEKSIYFACDGFTTTPFSVCVYTIVCTWCCCCFFIFKQKYCLVALVYFSRSLQTINQIYFAMNKCDGG